MSLPEVSHLSIFLLFVGNVRNMNNSNTAPWAGMMGVAAPRTENSFTPMGRGLSIGMEGKYCRASQE